MKIKRKYLEKLLEELVKKYNVVGDKSGLDEIGDKIGITREYLYKKISNPVSKIKHHESLGLRDGIIKRILGKLGFENIGAFCDFVDNPITEQAHSLVGSYYSYVRRNTKEGVLLRSPVQIFEKDRKIVFLLTGGRTEYSGEVKIHDGVISILLENKEGKFFNHVYRIGNVTHPKVVQGIFSGVTSTFDPIGGRVVLERRNEKFPDLKTETLNTDELKRSPIKNNKILGKYFDKFADNNLKVKISTSFDFSDLE